MKNVDLKVGEWIECSDYFPNELGVPNDSELNVTMHNGTVTSLCWTNTPESYFYNKETDDVYNPYDEVMAWTLMPKAFKTPN